jgi:hypothetical protein
MHTQNLQSNPGLIIIIYKQGAKIILLECGVETLQTRPKKKKKFRRISANDSAGFFGILLKIMFFC